MSTIGYHRPTPYAPGVQDASGNPLPRPRNNIPTALRPAIAALGASVRHVPDFGTEVEIPGARVKTTFAPGGRIWTANPYYPDKWILNTHMRGWDPETVLSHIASGSQDHFGTHHHLRVSQTYQTDGENHWLEPHASLLVYPNGRPHSSTWPKWFRDFQALSDQHHPPEFKGFARDVLHGHAPIEALADWLGDQHGIGDLIRPHGGDSSKPGADDYYTPPPTNYASGGQDAGGELTPESGAAYPANIPVAIHQSLRQLGAIVTPMDGPAGSGTHVRIPGGRMEAHFGPRGQIRTRFPDGHNREWQWDRDFYRQGDQIHSLVGHLAEGHVEHEGPNHSLTVRRFRQVDDDGNNYFTPASAHLLVWPDGKHKGRLWSFSDSKNPPEAVGFADDVLHGRAPIEALVDWLADHHGVSQFIRGHPDAPTGQSTQSA